MGERMNPALPSEFTKGLSGGAVRVYQAMLLNASAKHGWQCWETLEVLAERATVSKRTAIRAVIALEAAGFLTKAKKWEHSWDRRNVYDLHVYRANKRWVDDRRPMQGDKMAPCKVTKRHHVEGDKTAPSKTRGELADRGLGDKQPLVAQARPPDPAPVFDAQRLRPRPTTVNGSSKHGVLNGERVSNGAMQSTSTHR